ncbi:MULTISPECIES: GntR family transcriptional regulator [Paenibacillus]|uniref:GntR family transcriptional regulator n=1 Tax=Paenibacillus naphthalenovorans TaxID=162209 RepID=A0A0U2MXF9_9BACL|nr:MULTISPECIES: GntR family transcriptional regulator [Paenibacillus]ALS22815.1 GntR family transcriptional regulator [Paenibacillus naphthalenovorans]GCL70609.1 GntR family transcriptional regulator [Paenibacillus naphthalenovorans]SDH76958.1 DNA-binding transcriptional regulator, GntR family [Paenibacillus naphthalenovorans]
MKQGKTDLAYRIIKGKILSGELKALSDISEDRLQEELNISRTPIREALQKLEQEKLVYIYPRKGIIVSGVTVELLNEVYEMRELIEPFVAKSVCRKLPEDWLLNMKQRLVEPPEGMTPEERKAYYIDLDKELHNQIIYSYPNTFIHNIMGNIYDHNHRIFAITSSVNEKHNVSIPEHVAIIEAFLERDPDKVEMRMKEHIVSSRKNAIEYLIKQHQTREE